MSLSRDFLLTVRIFFSINRNNSGKNSKGFRVFKKRNDTDYFFKVNKKGDSLQENNIINT